MSRQIESIWTTLRQSGVVDGDIPKAGALESPWYVKGLLGFSGWLGALFLLGFLAMGLGDLFDSGLACTLVGAAMIGGAFGVLRSSVNDFLEHLALAVSLAGQSLIVFAIFEGLNCDAATGWLLIVVLQGILALFMPNFVHRVFSSFFAAFAFSMIFKAVGWLYITNGLVLFLAATCWLNEFRYSKHIKKLQAIGYGLVLALIQLTGTALFDERMMDWVFDRDLTALWVKPWMGEVLIGAVMFYVLWKLLQRYGQHLSGRVSITVLFSALLVCVLSMKVQGFAVGMVILLLGFSASNCVLMGLGIIALLFYIFSYYYLLEVTLLNKSLSLLIVGLVLLAVRGLALRILLKEKEDTHV